MTQIGEGLAAPSLELKSSEECFVCGKNHPAPKPPPGPVKTAGKDGWNRVSMAGVFEDGDGARKSVYAEYPPKFGTEGHHCLALSSFVKGDEDELPRLNHYLDKAGFKPNDPKNIIQLPGRGGYPGLSEDLGVDIEVEIRYQTFFKAAKTGKPLQLHLGRHKKSYFSSSDALVRRLIVLLCTPLACEESDEKDILRKLKECADAAMNYAFIAVAEARWVCHPEHLNIARKSYQDRVGPFATWPDPSLDCGPFG